MNESLVFLKGMEKTLNAILKLNENDRDILFLYVNGHTPLDISLTKKNIKTKTVRGIISSISRRIYVDRSKLRSSLVRISLHSTPIGKWDKHISGVLADIRKEINNRIAGD